MLVKPLVNLIWLAGFVFLVGSLVALWPDAREQRRLVARLALARGVTALVAGRRLIAVAAVLLVALPFLREPRDDDDRIDATDRRARSGGSR